MTVVERMGCELYKAHSRTFSLCVLEMVFLEVVWEIR